MEHKKLSMKDWLIIAGLLFEAGGALFMLKSHDARIEKLEGINPQLIEYRLKQIEYSTAELGKDMDEIKDLIRDLQ